MLYRRQYQRERVKETFDPEGALEEELVPIWRPNSRLG